ncbi:MAG: hypothetical protein GWN93_06780 [Deltaproteobacteria bacterium]|nr:hypothetical protein [Deltaproteobacteria bacterium]
MGKGDIVETKTYDFDQMLKDQAAQATHPAAIVPLIKMARKAGSRGTARALQRVQRRLAKQVARDAKRLARERAKLERQAATQQPVYQPPAVGVRNKWGEVVVAKPLPAARAQGQETMAVKNAFGEWVEVTVSSQGGRGATSCTSGEYGSPTHPRERSIAV